MPGYPFPLADPADPGIPPRLPDPTEEPQIASSRAASLAARPRRLAVLDTHLPWRISGFRYDEFEEFHRQLPDTQFYSLFRMTDPFPTEVHPLADFPRRAVADGVTDVYMVFFNFAAGVLGLEGSPAMPRVPNARPDLSLAETFERWDIRTHVTIYPGGGLMQPATDAIVLGEMARRCATVFTSVDDVRDLLPSAVSTSVPVNAAFYQWRDRTPSDDLRIVFVADDQPRKGMRTLLEAMAGLGPGYSLDVVGPQERYAPQIAAVGGRLHGWLSPAQLREILWSADVMVAPASQDLPEDGYGEIGVIDGFPTTAARVAMLSGCCLIGSNPAADRSMLTPGSDYLEFPERDADALRELLRSVRGDAALRRRVAAVGAASIKRHCDVAAVVAAKRTTMGL